MGPFHNRTDAGKILAKRILSFPQTAHSRPIIVALPKGGVPVAAALAKELFAPMDVLPVRRVIHPEDPELALGAVSDEGMVNAEIPASHANGIDLQVIERLGSQTRRLLNEQMGELRLIFPEVSVAGRNVIVVDDGLASGSTMEAAVELLKKRKAARITIAVPVTSEEGYRRLRPQVDDFFTLVTPREFYSIGSWYEEFEPVTDADVQQILGRVTRPRGIHAGMAPALAVAPSLKASEMPKATETASARPAFGVVQGGQGRGPREEIRTLARSLSDPGSLEILASRLAKGRVVMLGESSHGTAEFYELRRKLTQCLLEKHGFSLVAVEGDWPDFQELNAVIGKNDRQDPRETLRKFERWPTWMWANEEMAKLAEWMRGRGQRIYGLDIYSLFDSLNLVKTYAARMNAEFSTEILNRYACLDSYSRDEMAYAEGLKTFPEGCRKDVVEALRQIVSLRLDQIQLSDEELFDAKQNAQIIERAEEYYRAMIEEGPASWNVRDRHMLQTLNNLLNREGPEAKIIVWAHNSHVGDHRGIETTDDQYVTLGGLAREKFGSAAVKLVGFGTYGGSVTAGKEWGGPEEILPLPPARKDSWESYLHQVSRESGISEYWMSFDTLKGDSALRDTKGQRAVGVVYRPGSETTGETYAPTRLADRYDAFIYIDHSSALPSLHAQPSPHLMPEAWPTGQ
ncbi:MAG: hypothetical protein EOP11_07915 [Proteobacteria bacterium]|nr:MAG: hypothetical protein EOP11_07915 [Pseudomonadota bacterium]